MAPTQAPAAEPGAQSSHDRRVRAALGMRLRAEPVSALVLGKRSTVDSLCDQLSTDSTQPLPDGVALITEIGDSQRIVLTVVTSQRAALNQVRTQLPDAILVEIDSRPQSRVRFCRTLRSRAPGLAILAMGLTPPAGPFDFDDFVPLPLTEPRAEDALVRLRERSRPQVLAGGPFKLNASARTVETPNGTRHLTPKLAALLEFFLLHCNEVVPRSDIMAAIWQTSYLDDTRTLDVHVRWLRESIEPDPSNPRYLITERGVGYSLRC